MDAKMFCYQCQETAGNTGCTVRGVCGKTPEVAQAQDLLVYLTKGLAELTTQLRNEGKKVPAEADYLITQNLFTTVTNVNFDLDTITERIKTTLKVRDEVSKNVQVRLLLTEATSWTPADDADIMKKAAEVGVLSDEDEDNRSARNLVLYGIKGMAAYVHHANVLGVKDDRLDAFMAQTLAKLNDTEIEGGSLISLALQVGNFGMLAMSTLEKANTEAYGKPEITEVNIGVRNNPGILISGHDLKDLEMLLEQTKGTGVDVYTHGEMIPAHSYPFFKKYDNLVGNYGTAWWNQTKDFETFNGPILMTTNCIVPPKDSYKDRIYTTSIVEYPGVKHIPGELGEQKDFSEIIEQAKKCAAPTEIETGSVLGGFGHDQLFALEDKIVAAVKEGKIKQFIVMAGCDGRQKSREYYTEFAKTLPEDTVILTAGCAKYRYNKLNLGDIDGIPRVIDAGQCNDCYSLIMLAVKLQNAFGVKSVNDLPLVFNIGWYEQKAVLVLLTLLSLDIKKIHLGPTLPGFLSETVTGVIAGGFKLTGISTVEEDMVKFFTEEKPEITKHMLIGELLEQYPGADKVLMDLGLACVSCSSSLRESIEEACGVHHMEVNELIKNLKVGLGIKE